MKKILLIGFVIVAVIGGLVAFFTNAMKKITYSYTLNGGNISKFNIQDFLNTSTGAILTVTINVLIKNLNNFYIPVNYLYYEIYYANKLLGKSANTENNKRSVKILANSETRVIQDIDVFVSQSALGIAKDALLKTGSEYTVKIFANVFIFNIKLNNLKFKA